VPVKKVFSFEETRTREGNLLYIPFHRDQATFQFIYTHSIHLSDVVETYEVTEENRIRSISMEYEDVAIGMPGYAEEGQTLTILENGHYYLTFEHMVMPSFTMHLSDIISKQTFMYDGQLYDLKEILPKGSSYLFSVKKISIFQWWKGGYYKYDKQSDTN
jgi:hypothetical protein